MFYWQEEFDTGFSGEDGEWCVYDYAYVEV
jgi:hypothetical protein